MRRLLVSVLFVLGTIASIASGYDDTTCKGDDDEAACSARCDEFVAALREPLPAPATVGTCTTVNEVVGCDCRVGEGEGEGEEGEAFFIGAAAASSAVLVIVWCRPTASRAARSTTPPRVTTCARSWIASVLAMPQRWSMPPSSRRRADPAATARSGSTTAAPPSSCSTNTAASMRATSTPKPARRELSLLRHVAFPSERDNDAQRAKKAAASSRNCSRPTPARMSTLLTSSFHTSMPCLLARIDGNAV
jgi:hypothetical protein